MFKITSYGAAQEVTGSKHLIEVGGKKILLDCGMFQGRRTESMRKNREFGFDVTSVDAIVLSHAHIDHCGLLPKIVKDGFEGPIYCTIATKDLLDIMLKDSAHIQESDFDFFKRHKEYKGLSEAEPIYTMIDVQPTLDLLKEYHIHEEFHVGDVKIKFFGAGHILGAAMVFMEYNGKTLLFTGDIGRKNVPMLLNAETPDADYIMMESTYGGRKHEPVSLNRKSLVDVINKTASQGGKVIIPSFAVERTQEILYYLEEAFRQKELAQITIYVDSPMAIRVTDVFKKHTLCYNKEMQDRYESSIPFQNAHIVYTKTTDESKALNFVNMPCVIISASGMIEAGRIRHHVVNNIEDHKNTILIVGYMAENTLGRKLVEKAESVKIFGQPYKVKASVVKLNSFSGHADEDELLEWLSKVKKPSKVILVHGEMKAITIMKEKISALGIDTQIAEFGQAIET